MNSPRKRPHGMGASSMGRMVGVTRDGQYGSYDTVRLGYGTARYDMGMGHRGRGGGAGNAG